MSVPSKDLEALRQDAERLANQLPRSSSRDEALEIAIQAAQTSLDALKLVTDPLEKAKYSTRAKQLLREAEDIKKNPDWKFTIRQAYGGGFKESQNPSNLRVLPEPRNSRVPTTKEKIILLRAGFLNGTKFPEWEKPPSPSEFELEDGKDLFFDEYSELPLSDFQHDVLDGWKRPIEAMPPPSWFPGDRTNLGPTMTFYSDVDLVQDAATDCSVVASLCAGVARSQRGHQKIGDQFMYPYDHENDSPRISKNGKYIARMNFNGCYRRVVIDDRLPTSSTGRVIHVVDRNNPGLLWPALLEKAYLKIRGGYDFPGSNSATDLWILTGWIPEQVFLQSDDLELDRLWARVSNAFSYGDVFITMGTGKMSGRVERALGLASEHDYAVLDLREVEGQRLMLIKNPWAEGTSWKGRFKRANGSEKVQSADKPLIQLDDDTEPVASPRDLLNKDEQLTPGTFWMDIDNVVQNFEFLYLNWNPGLFSYRQDIHFEWDLSSPEDGGGKRPRGPYASLLDNRQFTVTATKKESIWILLWRHFQNSVPEDANPEDIESDRPYIDLNGHISLAVFSSDGKKVLLPDKALERGPYVDSPQALLKLEDCEPGKVYTIVPREQNLPATKHTFTLSAFSRSPIAMAEALPPYNHQVQLHGRWTKESAGGNAQYPTYCDNPQFSINVPNRTNISLLLEACDQQLNVHVKLLHSGGKRVFEVRRRDIIVDSKDYRPGCCLAEIDDLDAGQYTIMGSTFEPQQLGDFGLCISSSQPIKATLLPREGAGRLRVDLSIAAFKHGETKIAAPLVPRRLMNLYAIARHLDQQRPGNVQVRRSNYSQIRLSIELGRGPMRRILMASNNGEYSDGAGAVRTEPLDLAADYRKYGHGDCWIVLDRMYVSSEAQEERFSVELYVDQLDAVEVGVWRSWED